MKAFLIVLGILICQTTFAIDSLATDTADRLNVSIVTDVGFASSTNDSRKETNSGTGTLGLKFEEGRFYGSASFTVYSQNEEVLTSDTIETKLFGSNLLLPKNSSGSIGNFSGTLGIKSFYCPNQKYNNWFKDVLGRRVGAYVYAHLNSTNWTKDTITTPVSIISVGGNITIDFINAELSGKTKDKIRLYGFVGIASRILGGDYGIDANEGLREYYLGTSQTKFFGIESGARLEIGKFYGQITSTSFNNAGNILGFSGFQSVISLGLKADLNLGANNRIKRR